MRWTKRNGWRDRRGKMRAGRVELHIPARDRQPGPGRSRTATHGRAGIDGRIAAFHTRPSKEDWPGIWTDATKLKVRRGAQMVLVAVIIAIGLNSDWRREVPGLDIGTCEGVPFE